MASVGAFAGSSVGKKVLVAITGLLLIGYLVLHLLGNLTLLVPDGGVAFNQYAHFLEGLFHGGLVIVFEVVLVVLFLVHAIWALTVAWLDKERARPHKYAVLRNAGGRSRKNLASRSMILTGPLILLFVIVHVKMFKFADFTYLTHGGVEVKDLYAVVVAAFKDPLIMIAYEVAMILLGIHLWHGAWSGFQSMGWNSDRQIELLTRLSIAAAVVLGGGFLILPPYVYFFVDQAARGGH